MLDNLAAIPDDRRLELDAGAARPARAGLEDVRRSLSPGPVVGPKGFTNPVVELDFEEGGRWHRIMRGPDGRDYPADSIFIEITPPERIVYRNAAAVDEVFGDNPPPSFLRIITFTDLGDGRTRLHPSRPSSDTAENKAAVMRRGFPRRRARRASTSSPPTLFPLCFSFVLALLLPSPSWGFRVPVPPGSLPPPPSPRSPLPLLPWLPPAPRRHGGTEVKQADG